MLNQCNFIGRCARDPELKFTPAGKAVCNMSIACSEKYKGEEHTEWVNLVFWDKLAEIVGQYIHKGSLIFVSGKMQTRSWEDKEGNKKYTTEIVVREMKMLDGKKAAEADGRRDESLQADAVPEEDPDCPF